MPVQMSMEQVAQRVHSYDREQCIEELIHFKAMRLDFTRDALERMSIEKLRHLLLAAHITVQKYSQIELRRR